MCTISVNPSGTLGQTTLSKILYDTSAEILGYKKRRHKDWFDENDAVVAEIVAEKNRAHNN